MSMKRKKKTGYGSTSDGVQQYVPTGIYYTNKWHRGKVIHVSTGKTGKKEAETFLAQYLDKLDKGLDPSKPYPDEKPALPPADKPAELTDNATGLSFTFADTIDRLSLTIQAKQREDRITSRRSVKYREECITYVMRSWGPADIRLRQMGSFTVEELEEFRKRVLTAYSRSRYNGMMQNVRALFDEAIAAKAIKVNPCRILASISSRSPSHLRTLTCPRMKNSIRSAVNSWPSKTDRVSGSWQA